MHLFTFSSQGSSCSSPTYFLISISAFFSGKIPSHVAARLPRKYWVPNFRHFVTIRPPLPLFATICYYSSLFETIRHYSQLFATIRDYSYTIRTIRYSRMFAVRCSLFATIRCSLFGTIRYSLFGFSRHPNVHPTFPSCSTFLASLHQTPSRRIALLLASNTCDSR